MKTTAVAVLLLLAAIALPLSAAPSPAPQAKISRITIRGTDIFDMDLNPKIRHFPYTTINLLHIKTRDEVIRQELLFSVGDNYDPFLVAETERNLRALAFIRAARIAKFPQRDGTVALVVHVNDAWTTEPQMNLGGINKVEETQFGFREKNILGLGKEVQFLYSKGKNFTRRNYEYNDPRLLGSRFQLQGLYTDETAGSSRSVRLERPFYSADTRFATHGFHERSVFQLNDVENNLTVSKFEQTKEVTEAAAATKIGHSRDVVSHVGLRYLRENRWYARTAETAPTRPIPVDQKDQTAFLDFDTGRTNFVEMTHLEKMTRVEDLNLGPFLQLSPGYSPRALTGKDSSVVMGGSFEKRLFVRDTDLFHQKFAYKGRDTFRKGQNETYEVMLKYYRRPSDFHTTVFHTRIDWGNNLDPDNPVKLGSANGLRAFESDRFIGSKSLVMNVEDRIYLIDEAFNLLAVGAAVFADSGYAWPAGRPVAFSKMRSEVGGGLRFGLTRSSNEVVLRFDITYRLQSDERDSARWVFTFGTGQAF